MYFNRFIIFIKFKNIGFYKFIIFFLKKIKFLYIMYQYK